MITLAEISNLQMGLVLNRKKAGLNRADKFDYEVVSLKSFNENSIYNNTFADEFISNTQIKDDYKVKQGDTLEAIAKKYKVSVKKLKIDNKKSGSKLKIGENIEIIK